MFLETALKHLAGFGLKAVLTHNGMRYQRYVMVDGGLVLAFRADKDTRELSTFVVYEKVPGESAIYGDIQFMPHTMTDALEYFLSRHRRVERGGTWLALNFQPVVRRHAFKAELQLPGHVGQRFIVERFPVTDPVLFELCRDFAYGGPEGPLLDYLTDHFAGTPLGDFTALPPASTPEAGHAH